jgi:Fe-S-cluster containining protein
MEADIPDASGAAAEHPAAVAFSAWLRDTCDALAEKREADVPCGPCNACCRTSHYIHVRPEDRRALKRLPRAYLSPAPDLPPGNLVLGFDEAGRCPMLVDGRCTIYADRPRACRTYDCRIYAAAGIEADRPDIDRQARHWRFTYPTERDREELAAVRAAVAFVRGHPEAFPSQAAHRQPLRVAVCAIAVHEHFLERPRRLWRPAETERRRVRAVADAHELLFGDG